jgi:hypothetical protein
MGTLSLRGASGREGVAKGIQGIDGGPVLLADETSRLDVLASRGAARGGRVARRVAALTP